MKTRIQRFLLTTVMLAVTVSPLGAQIVADGATRTLINETNAFPGNLVIGTNNSFTLLVLSDNALLGNAGNGIIGLNVTAKSNEVRLISPTAYWYVGSNLFISSNGAFNRLTISNGARVESQGAVLGGFHFLGTNNEVVVSGAGSLWTNTGLSIGVISSGNRLVINNGGRVSSISSMVGVAHPVDASNNTALVTGTGSTWNNQAGLDIGYSGSSCRLIISNGAFVDNALGRIGFGATGQSASNCQAVVTGLGSVWSNRTGLHVGEFGNAARLEVTNGGALIVLGDVLLGRPFTSTNNRILVTGGTLRATNAAGTATLDLLRGTNQFNAGVIETDFLRTTNALGVLEFNGGLLTTRGAFISNSAPLVVGGPGNIPALWDVRAGLSNYFLSGDLHIGSNSSLNQLLITNGARLNNNAGILGSLSGANSNLAVVAGMNSYWSNRADLDVGLSGAGNRLVVANGGVVRNNFGILGVNSSSSNNVALVAGPGSVWTNANDVYVGRSGAGNQLLVSDGGLVRNNDGYLGINTGSSNNLAVVTDPGSVWSNAGALFLGDNEGGNRLVVSNAGVVLDSFAYFGLGTGSSNNLAVVTDSGSLWSHALDLYLGFNGDANQLIASNGATVLVGGSGVLGRNGAASSNTVSVTGPGTSWLVTSNVYVGSNGAFNLLVVSDGSLVANNSGIIGSGAASSNNLALVTGAGSLWSNASLFGFYVGLNGRGNQLVVSNGGVLRDNGFASVGGNPSSSNNLAVVTSPGSMWDTANLYVGANGAGNRLVVSNGGVVRDGVGDIGVSSAGSNNTALVTGSGSLWSNAFSVVGDLGSGNLLVVSNGGVVFADSAVYVGFNAASANNRLVVDGGTLRTTNFSGTSVLDVRRGTNVLNAGLVEVDQLLLTNTSGFFEFNGGTLSARSTRVTVGATFRVGNGVSPATFNLAGNGLHQFAVLIAAVLSSNATLTGNGTIAGPLQVAAGGKLMPGASIGKVVLSNSPSLQGTVVMETSKNGSTLTNDQLQVIGPLTYNGSLTVTHAGPDPLAAGDNFQLFVAPSYAGAFSSISLPALGPELIWTNKLLVDGSIGVISIPPGDHFWTNSAGGNYVIGANWLLNSVPGPRDNAVFTNNAGYQVHAIGANFEAANAFFDAASGTVTQNLANSSWLLTNSYVVGRNPSAIAAVTHVNGSLRATNAAGTARLVIGESGRGTFHLNGGSVLADLLFATNNGPTFTNSAFNFNFGNLTTLQGSVITQSHSFLIGNSSNQTATWTMPQGTNVIVLEGLSQTVLGNVTGSRGVVNASGPSTVWSNSSFLVIGASGSGCQMNVRDGANVISGFGSIGRLNSVSNIVWISDPGSQWIASGTVEVGTVSPHNLLVVSNGAAVVAGTPGSTGVIGNAPDAANNLAIVTGAGSVWGDLNSIMVGLVGSANRLIASNGGWVLGQSGFLGLLDLSSNNVAMVTDPDSLWRSTQDLTIGYQGSRNTLIVSNRGTVSAGQQILIGAEASSTNNRVIVDGGALEVFDDFGNGFLDVRRGTNVLNSGLIVVDQLRVTNLLGAFEFNGGLLQVGHTTVSNGSLFEVPRFSSTSPATLELVGNGIHQFANNLTVRPAGVLKGSGTVSGNVFISGALEPGASIGRLAIAGGLTFDPGAVARFELDKAAGTNDSVVGLTNLFYHGTLVVTNLAGTLANGDRFDLFDYSTRQASAFTSLVLPPLNAGLKWRNRLMMDGSLEVLAIPTRDFGVDVSHFQDESGVPQASWNQMFADGKRFAFIKATEGLTGPHDPTMATNVARAAAAGLLVGVYHYAHPENRPTTNGAILEASNMVVYAGSAIGPGRLRPVLDIEGAATTLSTTALTDWVIAFSNEIIARRGPAAAPIIYCNQSSANFEFDSRLANYDLWLRTIGSSDPATDDPLNALGFDPTGVFNEWSFWQYSDTGGSGGINPLDLDVCHSEYKPLTSYLIPGSPPAPIAITGASLAGGGDAFQLTFTNTPGALFTILATTNIADPLNTWLPIGTATEIAPGVFQFTDTQTTNHQQRYFRVRSP